MFRQLHMTLKVRLITHLFQETIFASTIPFVAFYLTDMLSVKLTGILLTLTVVFSMLFSFIGGYVSDLHKKVHHHFVANIDGRMFIEHGDCHCIRAYLVVRS